MQHDDPQLHGWNANLSVDWIFEAYPKDICDLLVSNDDEITVPGTSSDEVSDDDNDE